MTKKSVRKIALSFVLLQLLSGPKTSLNIHHELPNHQSQIRVSSTIKEDNYYHIIEVKNLDGEIEYKRTENDENRPISIFDEENIDSKQYGANQLDMKNHYEELMKDPYIQEEMENILPSKSFTTKYEKEGYYRAYFNKICECGCGYVAAVNYIFKQFEGREKEFEKTFGFPMYTVRENGYVDFNYEVMILKFFNHSISKVERVLDLVLKVISREALDYAYKEFEKDNIKVPTNYRELSAEEQQKFFDLNREHQKIGEDIKEKLHKAPIYSKEESNFGLTMALLPKSVQSFLKKYGVDTSGRVSTGSKEPFNELDILAGENYILYYDEGNMIYDPKVEPHAIISTGDTENGYTPVSSWGIKLYYDAETSLYTTKVKMKTITQD